MDEPPVSDAVARLLDAVPLDQHGLGGSYAAAASTVAAASVVVAVARASQPGWDDAAGIAAQAAILRERAAELAVAGAAAFASARSALHGEGTGAAGERLQHAADVPFTIGGAAADVAELAALTARHGDPSRRADAVAAAGIAEAAAHAACVLIEVNLAVRPGDERLAAARHDLAAATEARASATALLDL